MSKYKNVTLDFWPNGVVTAFSRRGSQIPALQRSWLKTILEELEKLGLDLASANIKADGRTVVLHFGSGGDLVNYSIG